MEYFTKIKIEISDSGGETLDSLGPSSTIYEAEMSDCSVHAWFTLFERVLRSAGFDEQVIAAGGCQLAFNEFRSQELMRKVAHEYDLKLLEDALTDDEDSSRPELQQHHAPSHP